MAEQWWERKRKIFTAISNKGCARPGWAPCYLHLTPHLCSAGRLSVISLLTFHHFVGGTQSESRDEEKLKEVGPRVDSGLWGPVWLGPGSGAKLHENSGQTSLCRQREWRQWGGTRGNWMFEEGKWQPGRERLGHNLTRSHSEIISGPQHICSLDWK